MAASEAARELQALAPNERSAHIDVVRGIAVFGLIWSNLNAGFRDPASSADVIARWMSSAFSAGKFYTIFSILFGVTLAMQLGRAEENNVRFATRWIRRMIVLYLIGWIHAILFWPGDILRAYAIGGAVLLLFRRASTRAVLFAAAAVLALGATRQSLSVLVTRATRGDVAAVQQREEPSPEQQQRRRAAGAAANNGSYLEVVKTRLAVAPGELYRTSSPPLGPLNVIPLEYLGTFLVGLALGRRRVLQAPQDHRRFLVALILVGAVLGLPLNAYLAFRPAWLNGNPVFWPLRTIAMFTLGLGYVAGLLLLLQRSSWAAGLRRFAPVGRMALTNYIAQTAFLTFIQYRYGLGLAPVLNSFACGVIAVAFYAFQVAYSNWWVRRWRFGPVEWVWRSLTYGALQPMRVPAGQAGPNVSPVTA